MFDNRQSGMTAQDLRKAIIDYGPVVGMPYRAETELMGSLDRVVGALDQHYKAIRAERPEQAGKVLAALQLVKLRESINGTIKELQDPDYFEAITQKVNQQLNAVLDDC